MIAMDPHTGKLYPSLEDAYRDGVSKPVEIVGRPEDVERISLAVQKLVRNEEKRKARKAKRKTAQMSRRENR